MHPPSVSQREHLSVQICKQQKPEWHGKHILWWHKGTCANLCQERAWLLDFLVAALYGVAAAMAA